MSWIEKRQCFSIFIKLQVDQGYCNILPSGFLWPTQVQINLVALNNYCESSWTMCSSATVRYFRGSLKKGSQKKYYIKPLPATDPILICRPMAPIELRLAYSIGSGYTSVKHARMVGEVYDSDLLRYLVCMSSLFHSGWALGAS